jgi:hypothetical protein
MMKMAVDVLVGIDLQQRGGTVRIKYLASVPNFPEVRPAASLSVSRAFLSMLSTGVNSICLGQGVRQKRPRVWLMVGVLFCCRSSKNIVMVSGARCRGGICREGGSESGQTCFRMAVCSCKVPHAASALLPDI